MTDKLKYGQHSYRCQARQTEYRNLLEWWDQYRPRHCRTCRGWGINVYEDDPSPAGVGLSPGTMEFVEPCPTCIENGFCPQCGQHQLNEDGSKCEYCLWEYGEDDKQPNPPGLPEEPECECWTMRQDDQDDAVDAILDTTDLVNDARDDRASIVEERMGTDQIAQTVKPGMPNNVLFDIVQEWHTTGVVPTERIAPYIRDELDQASMDRIFEVLGQAKLDNQHALSIRRWRRVAITLWAAAITVAIALIVADKTGFHLQLYDNGAVAIHWLGRMIAAFYTRWPH